MNGTIFSWDTLIDPKQTHIHGIFELSSCSDLELRMVVKRKASRQVCPASLQDDWTTQGGAQKSGATVSVLLFVLSELLCCLLCVVLY